MNAGERQVCQEGRFCHSYHTWTKHCCCTPQRQRCCKHPTRLLTSCHLLSSRPMHSPVASVAASSFHSWATVPVLARTSSHTVSSGYRWTSCHTFDHKCSTQCLVASLQVLVCASLMVDCPDLVTLMSCALSLMLVTGLLVSCHLSPSNTFSDVL